MNNKFRSVALSSALAMGALTLAMLPGQARAWWAGYGYRPPVVYAPAPYYAPRPYYYAPPPVVYAPPPAAYGPGPYYRPHRPWIPGHYRGPYWVPPHWG